MMDRFDRTEEQRGNSADEIAARAFSRCQNWPKDRIGISGIAEALERVSKRFGVPMERIVTECAESSAYCPTDADLINVARSLKPADPTPGARKCPLDICDGSGWRQVCHLHTHHDRPGGGVWVEKEIITQAQFDELSRKVDWQSQMVYESRYRCVCHPPIPQDIEKKGKYA